MCFVHEGDKVVLEVEAQTSEGRGVFSSEKDGPIRFAVGQNQYIPAMEKEVEGMKVGESKHVTLTPENAYGPIVPEFIFQISREKFFSHIKIKRGKRLEIRHKSGEKRTAYIIDASPQSVTLDANHPLAGKKIELSMKVLDIDPE